LAGQGKRRFSIKFNFQMSNGVGLVFVEKLNKKYLIKKPIKTELNNFFLLLKLNLIYVYLKN
jgi:hypothetical protein